MDDIKTTECASASEFWECLSPEKQKQQNRRNFYFRGQGDDTWYLIPKALRENLSVTCRSSDQVFYEWDNIVQFVEYCDAAKLPVPQDSMDFRSWLTEINDKFVKNPAEWPPKELGYILALMQHFGMPTRLLDWSLQPLVAVYFAAKQFVDNYFKWEEDGQIQDKKIAVWILDPRYADLKRNRIEIWNIPPSNNRNMYAQSGRFTLVRQNKVYRDEPFQSKGCLFENLRESGELFALQKITLDGRFAPELLEKCEAFGVCDATIFPDYFGVFEAIRIRELVRKVKNDLFPEKYILPIRITPNPALKK